MEKGLRMKEQKNNLQSFAKLRSFPDAKIKQISYYTVPSLVN